MEVNQELPQLEVVLKEGLKRLKPHGRMCVITFHSLEDRVVKKWQCQKKWIKDCRVLG